MTSPIASIGSATPSSSSSSSSSAASSATLDQNSFLKLLIAQLSNQDPLSPMDSTTFVTQLAQFTAVEQATTQTQTLSTISTQLSGMASNDALSLVGKQVTVSGQSLTFDGSSPATANVTLGAAAANVTVSITDSNGNTIRTLQLGAKPAGPIPVTWDGRDATGQSEPAGSYSFSVTATTANGAQVPVSQNVTGVVTEINFDQGYPAMVLDSGITAPISQLVSAGAPPPSM